MLWRWVGMGGVISLDEPAGVIDTKSRLVVAIGLPLPGNPNDCRAFTASGVDRACRGAPVIAAGGYRGTGALIPHRRRRNQRHLSAEQKAENRVHRKAHARFEHTLSRLKSWKILRDCTGPRTTASTRPCSAPPDFTLVLDARQCHVHGQVVQHLQQLGRRDHQRRDHVSAALRQFLDTRDFLYRGRIENRIPHRNGPPPPMGA
ncbi:DDE superfamily endonuclease [Streptomyces sp. OK228]|nr:DDE superfamily endonuclease [Streptomyces sp. OK228]